MFGMVRDTGPSASQYTILRLIVFMLKFCVKVFTVSVFAKPLMDLIHVWHGDRNLTKILCDTIPTPVHDLQNFC